MNWSTDKLLSALYSAASNPEKWPEFLQNAAEFFDVPRVGLITHNFEQQSHHSLAYFGEGLAEASRLYDEHYSKYDGWVGMLGSKPGKLCLGHEYWPEQEMLKTPFYEEYLRKFDIRHMAAVITEPRAGFSESLSLYRCHSAERFDQESIAALDFLYPHLQTAFYTRRKLLALEARVGELEAALDNLDCPLVLLNSSFEAVLVNRSARKILDAGEGLIFRNRRLHASAPPESARLFEVLATAVNAGMRRVFEHAGWMTVSRVGKRALQVAAAPLLSEAQQFPGGAVAVVFLTDPELAPRLPSELLQTLYGLTRMEAQLALQLMGGMSLAEAADRNCVSKETVRTQIASVYRKTGTKRQSELVLFLMALSRGCPLD